MTDHFKKL